MLLIVAGKLAAEGDETHDYALNAVICAAEQRFEKALDWFEARHWAATLEERKAAEPIACRAESASSSTGPPLSSELLDVVDDVNWVRRQLYAAWMASHHLDGEERDGMQVVIAGALDKLTAAGERLDAARKAA